MRVVINGAGAAAIAMRRASMCELGVRPGEHPHVRSKGVLYRGRTEGMNPYKAALRPRDRPARTLAEALVGADVFVGLSVAGVVSAEMMKTHGRATPSSFALANPDPEIPYEVASEARPDAIVATGRSDYPNQVNNVLGFPFIFRGALDVRARAINDEMKLAAAKALAELAREEVPDTVLRAYGLERLRFGPRLPDPQAPRPPGAALGGAGGGQGGHGDRAWRGSRFDLDEYRERLARRFGQGPRDEALHHRPGRAAIPSGSSSPKGRSPRSSGRAASLLATRGSPSPSCWATRPGDERSPQKLRARPAELTRSSTPRRSPDFEAYVQRYYEMRQRKGVTLREARKLMRQARTTSGP